MASDRAFGLVMAAACAAAAFWPLLHHRPVRWAPAALGGAFAAAAALRLAALHPLNRAWTALAALLSRITTPLVCGLLFYMVVTPLAFLLRLRGKEPLGLGCNPLRKTYWTERQPGGDGTPPRESMRLQF